MSIVLLAFWPELGAAMAVNAIFAIGYFCFGMEPGEL